MSPIAQRAAGCSCMGEDPQLKHFLAIALTLRLAELYTCTQYSGCRTAVPRSRRLCIVCQVGQPGDEYHLVFEGQGLQHMRDRYPGLFEQRTVVQFMWQADLYGVAKFVTGCPGVYHATDPRGGQASDQP